MVIVVQLIHLDCGTGETLLIYAIYDFAFYTFVIYL